MARRTILQGMRIAVIAALFGAGFVCGSLTQHSANAELKELGGDVMKKAGGAGGALGAAGDLGNTIVDMEKHVDGLQKNLEVLRKVKAALGGG